MCETHNKAKGALPLEDFRVRLRLLDFFSHGDAVTLQSADGHVTLDPVVGSTAPSADPTRVTVTDCVDDSHWVEYTTSGGRAANPAGGRRRTTAVVARRPGAWKVTQLTVGAVGSC